jgi:regulator of sigma E protease
MNLLTALLLFYLVFAIVGSMPDRSRVQLAGIIPDMPASQAGFQDGDILISINGQIVHTRDEAHAQIYGNLGKPIDIVFIRDGVTKSLEVTPLVKPGEQGAIGVSLGYAFRPFNIFGAVPESASSLYDYGTMLFSTIGQAISGQASGADVRPVGIKGMFDMYSYIVQGPAIPGVPKVANALQFFAIISFSLGVMNLLPIPPLDGGKILFALPELIFRKRIPIKYEVWVSSVAFILLIILMLYINAQDFIHPILTPTP